MAIGACADLVVQPFGALIVGFTAGAISVWGFDKVSVILTLKLMSFSTWHPLIIYLFSFAIFI